MQQRQPVLSSGIGAERFKKGPELVFEVTFRTKVNHNNVIRTLSPIFITPKDLNKGPVSKTLHTYGNNSYTNRLIINSQGANERM
jgi:hypothetical protein